MTQKAFKFYKDYNPEFLTNEIALDIIRDLLHPDMQPLGIPFAWFQPNDDNPEMQITTSNVYGQLDHNVTTRQIIAYEVYISWNKSQWELKDIPLSGLKDILRELKAINANWDTPIKYDGILECPEIQVYWKSLDGNEKALYRLSLIMLNTMTSGHNFSCEYLEYLAYEYWNSDDKEWKIYEHDYNKFNDLLDKLCFYVPDLNDKVYVQDDSYYHIDSLLHYKEFGNDDIRELSDVREWITDDIIDDLFPDYCSLDYNDIRVVISWIIAFLQDEYKKGNLQINWQDKEHWNI